MTIKEVATTTGPSRLLEMAVAQDLDIDKLEKLVAMQERFDAREARKAFYAALSRFQSIIPEIKKTKTVSFISKRTGEKTEYNYAPLPSMIEQVKGALYECGLAYRWEISENDEIEVTYHLTHVDGHSEQTTMTAPIDTSGSKNAVQGKASTVQYLKRYTMEGGLGLAAADDNDAVDVDNPTTSPTAKEPVKEYNRETPFWLIVKGYEKWHGQPWTELPASLLQLMLDSETTDQTPVPYLKAIEVANDEIARRIEESGQ